MFPLAARLECPRVKTADLPSLFATLMGGGVLGTITTALVQGFRKPSSQAELVKVVQDASKEMIADLRAEIGRQHAECDRNLAELRLEIDELKNGARIDALMRGRVAGAGERAPKD